MYFGLVKGFQENGAWPIYLVLVVQRVDKAIHGMKLHTVDSVVRSVNSYPVGYRSIRYIALSALWASRPSTSLNSAVFNLEPFYDEAFSGGGGAHCVPPPKRTTDRKEIRRVWIQKECIGGKREKLLLEIYKRKRFSTLGLASVW